MTIHPLAERSVVRAIEQAAAEHRGRPWKCLGFTSLDDRASHPAGVLDGVPFSVFAKLGIGTQARDQFAAELQGLGLISSRAGVGVAIPVAGGVVKLKPAGAADRWLLLTEALPESVGGERSAEDVRAIGRTLAALHLVRGNEFGLREFDGFFGPFWQDNRPVPTNRWTDFYAERRARPALRLAIDSGNLPAGLGVGVERVLHRLPELGGAEPSPSLLHGDAQQNNFLCTAAGAVVIDPAPYYGHPETDLALVDYFEPISPDWLDAYREMAPIDPGFAERAELWRLGGYLAVVAATGRSSLGRQILGRLEKAVRRYR